MCYIWDRRVYFLKPSQNCARNTNKNNETSYFLFVLMPGPIHESPWALISKSTTNLPQLIVRRACSVRYQLPLGKELSQYLTKAPFQQIKMVNIEGVYTRTEEKDYDKFLSALGVGFLLRKAATSSTPTMTISKSGKPT